MPAYLDTTPTATSVSSATETVPAHQAATALAHAAIPASAVEKLVVAAPVVTVEKSRFSRADRKVLKRQLAAPYETKAEGKSQLTAALLALFVGFLGIHRFYLGYTGLGILELLTFGVFGILHSSTLSVFSLVI